MGKSASDMPLSLKFFIMFLVVSIMLDPRRSLNFSFFDVSVTNCRNVFAAISAVFVPYSVPSTARNSAALVPDAAIDLPAIADA